jgi:hypothetical protein
MIRTFTRYAHKTEVPSFLILCNANLAERSLLGTPSKKCKPKINSVIDYCASSFVATKIT